MQVTINTLSEVEKEADIVVTHEELLPHFDQAYEEFRPKVELKGFRKGRVPMPMIKQLYGEAIEQDALEEIAGFFFRTAMKDKNVEPMGRPVLTEKNYERGKGFSFKIKYEVRPTIDLHGYKGLELTKFVHPVEDTEVQDEIERLRRVNSTSEPAEKVVDENFAVTADVQELDDTGAPLIGRKTANVRFHLIDPDVAPEVKDALKNAENGQTYRATISTQHGDHAHTSNLSLNVTKIERVSLPPFDDALAKKATRDAVPTAEELRANIARDLKTYWEDLSNRRLNDDIVAEMVKMHEFTVPSSFVEVYLDAMVDDVRQRSRDKQLPRGFDEQKFRESNRADAIWQAKWMLIKDRIVEVEGTTLSDEDIENAAERDAVTLKIAKDRLLAHYKTSESSRDRLVGEKVMQFLKDHAKITEKNDSALV
ncbi:MAG: trigger factor [Bacteroidota bacterium]